MTTTPKVPVVICDGSGRASDLLAFAHRYIQEDGNLSEGVRPQLLSIIEDVFFYDKHDALFSYYGHFGMRSPTKFAHCLSPRGGLETDVDYAIPTALLKGIISRQPSNYRWHLPGTGWTMGRDWPNTALNNAMMEATDYWMIELIIFLLIGCWV